MVVGVVTSAILFGSEKTVPATPVALAATPEVVTTIEDRIRAQAIYYGVDPDRAVAIGQCESGLNPYAANSNSSAKGIYQFTDGTWKVINAPGHQYDPDENIKQFMIWINVHPEWWVCE